MRARICRRALARDRDRDYEQDRERDRDRRDYEHDRYYGRDWDRDRSRDRDRDHDRDRAHERELLLIISLLWWNRNVSGQTAKWVSSREAAELSGGSDRGTRQKASEKTVKTEDGVLGEFHGSTKASRRPMVERSPSSTSLERRFINNQSSARWGSEVEETGLRNNVKDFSAPEDERFRVDDTSQGNISFNNKAYLRKCHWR